MLMGSLAAPGRFDPRSLMLGRTRRFHGVADDLGALLVNLLELALEAVPRASLRLVVLASGEVAEAVAISGPRACPPLVELPELPSLDAVRREGGHARLLLWVG
jgi:hypothetical protein